MQSVHGAGGIEARVPVAMATLWHASTAKQPPKGKSAVDTAEAVASAVVSMDTDKEVQVRKVASVWARLHQAWDPPAVVQFSLSCFGNSGA